jgi:hypothetical protein
MIYHLLASLTVLAHLGFILFVVAGGFLLVRWQRFWPVHLGCAAWGAYTEFTGAICPLTPLENHFRRLAGEAGYAGGFIEHYIWPMIYPAGLTEGVQTSLGLVVVSVNLLAYARFWRWRKASRA